MFELPDITGGMPQYNDSLLSLDIAIPNEIYIALDSLTNFVGYIMPLRLYSPIITLILGYWLLSIMCRALHGFFGAVSTFLSFTRIAGKFIKK